MSKLDLGELLANNNPFQNVPNLGTVREQIEYINLALIDSDPNNFYELSDIDQLAANIELCGLQQPIRVRVNPDDPNRVIIVSGHRRRAAIEKLVQEGREDLKEVPCIRETADGSDALRELRLIYANSDTRRMSSADIIKQVERVQALLYQLKEEGIEFPGRMRDHVAEACKISKSKISRLKVIRDKLNPIWQPSFEAGALNESVAYALAQLPQEHQRIIYLKKEQRGGDPAAQVYEYQVSEVGKRLAKLDELTCPGDGGACMNCGNKHVKIVFAGTYEYVPCTGCCSDCQQLAHCKMACPKMAERIAVLKANEKERREQEKLTQEQIEKPIKERIQALWTRFGEARVAAGKSWDECCRAVSVGCWAHGGEEGTAAKEAGEETITANTKLPYGYNCSLSDVRNFVDLADLLGCSLDWLLCRTDNPAGFRATSDPEKDSQPNQAGSGGCQWYPATQFPDDKQELIAIDKDWYATDGTFQNGRLRGAGFDWDEVLFWTPAPDPDGIVRNAPQPSGQLMIAGWMPGGTTPAEPCEVVAVFSIGGNPVKRISLWNGSQFTFFNGTPIEQEPVKWMRLPPDETDDTDLTATEMALEEDVL